MFFKLFLQFSHRSYLFPLFQVNPTTTNCSDMGTDALNSRMVSLAEYIEFLQYKACKQTSSEIASVVQTGNSVTCFSQSSSSESWVIDSGASDHISGNKSLFTTISYSQSLPRVTMANGSQTMATAIGQASPLLYL